MPTGKIKWFNHQIGADFIRSDEGENIFFCTSVVHSKEAHANREGQTVCFVIAKNIKTISQTAARVTTVGEW